MCNKLIKTKNKLLSHNRVDFTFPEGFVGCLTDRIRTPQTKTQMAKSPILVKLGWFDHLMGGVHHAQYFGPGTTLVGVAAHPNSGFTSKR